MSKSDAHFLTNVFYFYEVVCISDFFPPLSGARKLSSDKILQKLPPFIL